MYNRFKYDDFRRQKKSSLEPIIIWEKKKSFIIYHVHLHLFFLVTRMQKTKHPKKEEEALIKRDKYPNLRELRENVDENVFV
jgi:hypothetical protein